MKGVVAGDPILLGLNREKRYLIVYGLSVKNQMATFNGDGKRKALLNWLLAIRSKVEYFVELLSTLWKPTRMDIVSVVWYNVAPTTY